MRHLIRLTDWQEDDAMSVFRLADEISGGKYGGALRGQSVVLFFPPTSLLTRTTFERAVYQLGGQAILFPSEMLDKTFKNDTVCDMIGYLNNWAGGVVIRYRDIALLEQTARFATIPVINAMTDSNHPCEILSDLYAMSKLRADWRSARYLFVGVSGNIGNAWHEAAQVFGLDLTHCCPAGYEMSGVRVERDIHNAIRATDIVLTDPLPRAAVADFAPYRITEELMREARLGAVLDPCPQFNRGEEVSPGVIDSGYFVGYGFKKHLVAIQQAVIVYCTRWAIFTM
jgi:ornithine carbamoyltransferase